MPEVGSELCNEIKMASLSWRVLVRVCGDGVHQGLVVGEYVKYATFHKIPEMFDGQVHSEEFTVEGAVQSGFRVSGLGRSMQWVSSHH